VKINRKREFVAQGASHGRVLAAFLAMALSATAMGRAQAKPAQLEPSAAHAGPALQADPAAPAGQPSAGESQPKGSHEGIQIHGHWTIEVKNPDGKLVTHREFENGLSNLGGASLLSGILAGAVTPGSWWVNLESSNGDAIVVAQPGSSAATGCSTFLANLKTSQLVGSCSDNLSVAGAFLGTPGNLSGGLSGTTTVTLTGSGTVPKGFPATIGYVETDDFVCLPSLSPAACFDVKGSPSIVNITNIALTARGLNGRAGTTTAPVSVSAGQSVSVTVVISFGSGS
jgi:hypothetical protein